MDKSEKRRRREERSAAQPKQESGYHPPERLAPGEPPPALPWPQPPPGYNRRPGADQKSQGRVLIANAQKCADKGDVIGAERWVKLAERLVSTAQKLEELKEAERVDDVDELRAELRRRLDAYNRQDTLHERLEWPVYWQKLVFEWEGEEPPPGWWEMSLRS